MGRAGHDALTALGRAYREFAKTRPGQYARIQRSVEGTDAELEAAGRDALEVVLAVLRGYRLEGDETLHAARALRSALHGFVLLETGGGFGLDLDLDESYRWLLAMIEAGLTRETGGLSGTSGYPGQQLGGRSCRKQERVARTKIPLTVESLAARLRDCGLDAGQTVLVHMAMSKLGWIVGGAQAVILALLEVLGEDGTLMMPAHTSSNTDPAGVAAPAGAGELVAADPRPHPGLRSRHQPDPEDGARWRSCSEAGRARSAALTRSAPSPHSGPTPGS